MRILILSTTLLIASMSANASLILSPTAALAGSTNSGAGSAYDIEYAINGAGLYTPFVSGVTDFDDYLASNPLHDYLAAYNEWFGAKKGITVAGGIVHYPKDTVTFDLGDVFDIDRFALWNEENGGIGSVKISGSLDGIDFTELLTVAPTGNPFDPSTNGIPRHNLFDYGAEVFSFDSLVTARYFKFDMVCPGGNSVYAGCSIGEIAFSTPTPVPAPGSVFILTFGLMGFFRSKPMQLP